MASAELVSVLTVEADNCGVAINIKVPAQSTLLPVSKWVDLLSDGHLRASAVKATIQQSANCLFIQ